MNSIDNLNPGRAINVLCDRKHMKISELSKKSKVSVTAINKIRSGKTINARVETIVKLCFALEVSLAEFFTIAIEEEK